MKISEAKKIFERHVELYKTSKLSKAEYCRLNKLCYHRFNYWLRKTPKLEAVLVPVQIKPSVKNGMEYAEQIPRILCTLDFGRNGCLKIYDIQAMASIIERLI